MDVLADAAAPEGRRPDGHHGAGGGLVRHARPHGSFPPDRAALRTSSTTTTRSDHRRGGPGLRLAKAWTLSIGYAYEKYTHADAFSDGTSMFPQAVLFFLKGNDGNYDVNVAYAKLTTASRTGTRDSAPGAWVRSESGRSRPVLPPPSRRLTRGRPAQTSARRRWCSSDGPSAGTVGKHVAEVPAAPAAVDFDARCAERTVLDRAHGAFDGRVKLGHPLPLSYFVSEANSTCPQPAQANAPSRCSSSSGLVPGYSVSCRRSTAYCPGSTTPAILVGLRDRKRLSDVRWVLGMVAKAFQVSVPAAPRQQHRQRGGLAGSGEGELAVSSLTARTGFRPAARPGEAGASAGSRVRGPRPATGPG